MPYIVPPLPFLYLSPTSPILLSVFLPLLPFTHCLLGGQRGGGARRQQQQPQEADSLSGLLIQFLPLLMIGFIIFFFSSGYLPFPPSAPLSFFVS